MPRPTLNPLRTAALGALVFLASLLAYLPAISGRLIWNDSDYVTAPALRPLRGLARIWFEPGATQQYYPLLHSAFWVEHRLWGDRVLGYHLVTLVWHACSAVLLALVLRRLFAGDRAWPKAEGTAWVAAFLFALHPVNVESVAWISEQKNTLSLALYLASALAYLHFDGDRRPRAYVAAFALFALSLLCKTVTATLPAALALTFWWRRGRLDWRRDLAPLVPWLALGAAAGLFSSWVERAYVGAQGADFGTPALDRVLIAGRAIWFDLEKLIWPVGLNFIYPQWKADPLAWWQWLFPAAVPAFAAALWSLRRLSRGPLAAFLFFVRSALFMGLGPLAVPAGPRPSRARCRGPDRGLAASDAAPALAGPGPDGGARRAARAPHMVPDESVPR
jgi:protein O-mannosyl-transferase